MVKSGCEGFEMVFNIMGSGEGVESSGMDVAVALVR